MTTLKISRELSLTHYIYCKTNKGNYTVRPISYAGIFDKDGVIDEDACYHTAIVKTEDEAKALIDTYNADRFKYARDITGEIDKACDNTSTDNIIPVGTVLEPGMAVNVTID